MAEIVTKEQMFQWYAPTFNFELNADEIIARAIKVGFAVEVGDNQYELKEDYGTEN